MSGGMAKSSGYSVSFELRDDCKNHIIKKGVPSTALNSDGLISLFCTDAQLPNVSSQTGTQTGLYTGEGQVSYAVSRLFTDVSLGWYGDRDMLPMKFLQAWHDFIYTGDSGSFIIPTDNQLAESASRSEKTKLKYPSEYYGKIRITKNEDEVSGQSITYLLLDAFPYSIDATPLSYGSSQLVNISASFQYSRYKIFTNKSSIAEKPAAEVPKQRKPGTFFNDRGFFNRRNLGDGANDLNPPPTA